MADTSLAETLQSNALGHEASQHLQIHQYAESASFVANCILLASSIGPFAATAGPNTMFADGGIAAELVPFNTSQTDCRLRRLEKIATTETNFSDLPWTEAELLHFRFSKRLQYAQEARIKTNICKLMIPIKTVMGNNAVSGSSNLERITILTNLQRSHILTRAAAAQVHLPKLQPPAQ